eukprot:scaffold302_cov247-Pinguiococcus_pyrenoidosus.AAC.8
MRESGVDRVQLLQNLRYHFGGRHREDARSPRRSAVPASAAGRRRGSASFRLPAAQAVLWERLVRLKAA